MEDRKGPLPEAPARPRWEKPRLEELLVQQTAITPNRGTDGEVRWVDCTS